MRFSNSPGFTRHAEQRMSQRNVKASEIVLIRDYGVRQHRAGVVSYFLGRRQLAALQNAKEYSHLEGTVVICCPKCERVITVYRNRERGIKDFARKSKYDQRRRLEDDCYCRTPAHQSIGRA